MPPLPYALDCELSGVCADADIDEPFVFEDIVDTVRGGLAEFFDGEVVVEHLNGLALLAVLAPSEKNRFFSLDI
jgi:hypothetical protein